VRDVPRDLVLSLFAVAAAVLGIAVFLGPGAAAIGGSIIAVVFVIGAVIYGVLALAARWADR
jgi:hypothetical protein